MSRARHLATATAVVCLFHGRLDGTCSEVPREEGHKASAEARDKQRAIAARERLGDAVARSPVT